MKKSFQNRLGAAVLLFFLADTLVFSLSHHPENPDYFKKNVILYDSPVGPVIKDTEPFQFLAIGENHNLYSNHLKELEIIKEIYQARKNIAVSMEMFDREYQEIIDDYLNNKINEIEFLRKTEYFREWGFNYYLYKDIVDFAKANNIPIIGLNIKNEIVRHIGRKSFTELSSKDFLEIPGQIDFSNIKYKEALKNAFEMHGASQMGSFDNFYLAQLIRDEYMSHSAYNYHKEHPDKTIIILAGNGHIEFGYGIPSRIERLSGKVCRKVLIDSPFSPGAADFFVYTKEAKEKKSPRLNVMLSEADGKVKINSVFEQPESEKDKLKASDLIMSIDNIPVKSVSDIRLILFSRQFGDKLKIIMKRDDKEITIEYNLIDSHSEEED